MAREPTKYSNLDKYTIMQQRSTIEELTAQNERLQIELDLLKERCDSIIRFYKQLVEHYNFFVNHVYSTNFKEK